MRTSDGALLICFILLILIVGCQEAPEKTDPFKAADSSIDTSSGNMESPVKGGVTVQPVDAEALSREVVELQEDLEGFSDDIEHLENFGVENAASEIDRELDRF